MSNELDYFKHVAGDNRLKAWLDMQKADAVKALVSVPPTDVGRIATAQAEYRFASRQLELLEKAKGLR